MLNSEQNMTGKTPACSGLRVITSGTTSWSCGVAALKEKPWLISHVCIDIDPECKMTVWLYT